jgi:phosphate transport system substrate-binding protein
MPTASAPSTGMAGQHNLGDTMPPQAESPVIRRSMRFAFLASVAAAAVGCDSGGGTAQATRDYISIVGSSTVYPFSTVVAEQFGRRSNFKTPKIEPTGSGGGLKLFCNGIGVQHPDIANSSRAITASEVRTCAANGVNEIVEVEIGSDGIVLANAKSAQHYDLSPRTIYLALAKEVPDPAGAGFVANPYRTWSQIDPSLPDIVIEVLGPPPTSGTRDAFLELVMDKGCADFPAVKALSGDEKTARCHAIREDGRFVEAGENDNLIVNKLEANPRALGIFGFSFLEQNSDKVQGASINGIEPTFETIADKTYPVARPLFFYVKKAHVGKIPGIREFLIEFTSDSAWGDFGYLSDKGLIPLPEERRAEVQASVRALETLPAPSSAP